MPAMEHLDTMRPMVLMQAVPHMEVPKGTTPRMEVVLTTPTTPTMEPTMVATRTQLPLPRHTEHQLQHQAIIKRGSVLMSGDLKKHTSGH